MALCAIEEYVSGAESVIEIGILLSNFCWAGAGKTG